MWTYIGIRKEQQSFAHPDDTRMLSGSWTNWHGFEYKGRYCWYQPKPKSHSELYPGSSRQTYNTADPWRTGRCCYCWCATHKEGYFQMKNVTKPPVNIESAVKATDSMSYSREEMQCCPPKFTREEKWLKSSFVPLQKSDLQTFSNLVKSNTTKSNAIEVNVKADRGLFPKMVVTAN